MPLTIGGVDLGKFAKSLTSLRSWYGAKRLWINGSAIDTATTVTVRLTRRNGNDTTNTITAVAEKKNVIEAAESASYMMYYLIANESSVPEAEAANKFKTGLKLLGQYISGRQPKQLEAAYTALRESRDANTALYEAYLYEGVALDLLERHAEAIKRFEYISASGADAKLKEKAQYNVALVVPHV